MKQTTTITITSDSEADELNISLKFDPEVDDTPIKNLSASAGLVAMKSIKDWANSDGPDEEGEE